MNGHVSLLLDVLFGTFGVIRGPIHLSLVDCDGTEDSLFNCHHLDTRHELCYPSEPVGVICVQDNEAREFGTLFHFKA